MPIQQVYVKPRGPGGNYLKGKRVPALLTVGVEPSLDGSEACITVRARTLFSQPWIPKRDCVIAGISVYAHEKGDAPPMHLLPIDSPTAVRKGTETHIEAYVHVRPRSEETR